jgi:hypothetical protein
LGAVTVRASWSTRRRNDLLTILHRHGALAPLLYPGTALVQVIIMFAALTSLLSAEGVIHLMPTPESAGTIGLFYLWHFAKTVPLGDMTDTLRWEAPLSYADSGIGALILTFQLLGIVCVVSVLRAWWETRRPAESSEENEGRTVDT